MGVEPKSVLLVGANRGLGRYLLGHFAGKGYRTYSVANGPLDEAPKGNQHFEIDITDRAALRSCVSHLNGGLDGVVFCQRYRGPREQALNGELNTSVAATVHFLQELEPLLEKKFCSIILVGSVLADFVSLEMDVSYHICKAALSQMAKYYAVAWRDRAMVNCVQLGTFAKPETERFFDEQLDFFNDLSPQGKLMHCRDLAGIFQYLIDEKPRYLTGQSLTVDGGITSQWIESFSKARLK